LPALRNTLCLALVVAACATYKQQTTASLLASAGFRAVAANTPERIQALNSLPSRQISKVVRDGQTYFVYPDTKECRCLRVGREEQYERYKKLAAGAKAETLQVTGASTQNEVFKGYDPW
jgi:hypothetical protein